MKALHLKEKETLKLEEVSPPIPQKNEVLIQVEITGIGGSEYLGFKNPGIRKLPNILGHGICGTTSDGKRVAINPLLGCGDCEYCNQNLMQLCDNWQLIGVHSNGGFAQQVAVPKTTIVELPDHLSWEQASFIEPFANATNAWEIAEVSPEKKVLIIGVGGLGLGLVACAKKEQQAMTYVLEKSIQRNQAAKEMGAKIDAYEANYFDIVFDTVGTPETRIEAIRLMKRNGKCVFLGFATAQQEVNFSELIRMQYQFMGSFVYSKKQFLKAVDLVKYTNDDWVKSLQFSEVENQLWKYLEDDFSVVKAALRPHRK